MPKCRAFVPHHAVAIYLIVAFSIATHSCYIGSKVVMSLLALNLGASQATIGLLAALYALVPLMLGVYSGRLIDTIGTRRPMLFGSACIGVAMLISGLFDGMTPLFITAVLTGSGFVFFNVAVQTLVGGLGGPEQRSFNFSILSIGYSISTFIGPMSVGLAIDHFGHAKAFLMLATFTVFPVIMMSLTGRFNQMSVKKNAEANRSAIDLLRVPAIRSVVIISGLIVAAWDLFSFYLPVYAHSLGFSATSIGVILGVYSFAAFITRFATPMLLKRWRPERVMFTCVLIAAAGFVLFPIWKNFYAIMVISFLLGLTLGCGQPLSMMVAYDRSPAGRAGEVTGLRLTANNVTRVIIPVICGALGAAFGAAPVFWLNAVNLTAISVILHRQ